MPGRDEKKMQESTTPEVSTEALIAEAEDLRQRLRIETEQKEHFRSEATRLGNLAREAQEQLENAEDKFTRQANDLDYEVERAVKAEAEVERLQARLSATETHG